MMVHERRDLGEVFRAVGRRWQIPAALAVVGALIGLVVSLNASTVHRSQATLLVGPTDGVVTQSSTIRTSEDLAVFYADLARRQIVLEPVVDTLGLDATWESLRNRVSAVVPEQNLRLVTLTVSGDSPSEASAIANALMAELVQLNPSSGRAVDEEFINDQAAGIQASIVAEQEDVTRLASDLEAASTAQERDRLERDLANSQERIIDWQRTYVELIAVDPVSGAGGLQVLDQASAVAGADRPGTLQQTLTGGLVAGIIGLVAAWLIYRRNSADGEVEPGTPAEPASRGAHTGPAATPRNGSGSQKGASGNGTPNIARQSMRTKRVDQPRPAVTREK